jgi:AcrR family transcriptional regulator
LQAGKSLAGAKRGRPGPGQYAETLRQIREVGLALFIRNGFEATTVNELAARARVSRRTFFRYFASKENMIFSWVDEEAETAWSLLLDRSTREEPVASMRRAFLSLASRQTGELDRSRHLLKLIFSTPSLRSRFQLHLANWQAKLDDAQQSLYSADRDSLFSMRVQSAAAVAAYMTAVQVWIADSDDRDLAALVAAAFDALAQWDLFQGAKSPVRLTG